MGSDDGRRRRTNVGTMAVLPQDEIIWALLFWWGPYKPMAESNKQGQSSGHETKVWWPRPSEGEYSRPRSPRTSSPSLSRAWAWSARSPSSASSSAPPSDPPCSKSDAHCPTPPAANSPCIRKGIAIVRLGARLGCRTRWGWKPRSWELLAENWIVPHSQLTAWSRIFRRFNLSLGSVILFNSS